jgi:hypothetical protein
MDKLVGSSKERTWRKHVARGAGYTIFRAFFSTTHDSDDNRDLSFSDLLLLHA